MHRKVGRLRIGGPGIFSYDDGSGLHTLDASYAKAFAAVSFAAAVLDLETSAQLAERFGQQPNFQPPAGMLFRGGGVVIKQGNEVIGAIGVGGAPLGIQDDACAKAGIDKIRDRLKSNEEWRLSVRPSLNPTATPGRSSRHRQGTIAH